MKCRVCGGTAELEITTQDYMLNREPFDYCVCQDCGTWLLEAIPENIGDYYKTDYYSYNETDSPASIQHFRRVAKIMIKDFKLTETSSVLDYGGGSIKLLKGLYGEGVGIDGELHKLRCYNKFAPEVEWQGIKLQNKLPTDMKFDFILSKHCIEHEIIPDTQIKNILDLLSKDGIAHIVAPNPDSVDAEHFKGYWIGIDAPRHINVMPIKALKKIIERCGGDVIKADTVAEPSDFLTSEMYLNGGMWKDRDKYITDTKDDRISEIYYYSKICAEIGKADILAITFKKKKQTDNN